MGKIELLLIVWGAITAVLLVTMIYRSALANREEDQIFLDSAGESTAKEQRALVSKIQKLGPPIVTLAVLSGVMLVAIIGIWAYQSFQSF
jgi:hypothetical protein